MFKLAELFEKINQVRIGVIGDFCLDAYWEVDVASSEKSVETGLQTEPVRKQRYFPGGAGNVAANLAALGVAQVQAFGVLGVDLFADEMIRKLKQAGICADNMQIQQKMWDTCVYIKRIADGMEKCRVDFGNFNRLQNKIADRLCQALLQKLPRLDAVIVNQQLLHGVHTACFRAQLASVIRENSQVKFIVDSRNFGDEFPGAMRKMNDREACGLCGIAPGPDGKVSRKQAFAAAKTLVKRLHGLIFITRGSDGLLVATAQAIDEIPAEKVAGPVDTVGAGDTMLAALCATLAAGETPVAAAQLGTLAAAVSIQKLYQCGTANQVEIIEQAKISGNFQCG